PKCGKVCRGDVHKPRPESTPGHATDAPALFPPLGGVLPPTFFGQSTWSSPSAVSLQCFLGILSNGRSRRGNMQVRLFCQGTSPRVKCRRLSQFPSASPLNEERAKRIGPVNACDRLAKQALGPKHPNFRALPRFRREWDGIGKHDPF